MVSSSPIRAILLVSPLTRNMAEQVPNAAGASIYNEESIRSLDWKEHIRLRPGMYIGKLGDGSSSDDGI